MIQVGHKYIVRPRKDIYVKNGKAVDKKTDGARQLCATAPGWEGEKVLVNMTLGHQSPEKGDVYAVMVELLDVRGSVMVWNVELEPTN